MDWWEWGSPGEEAPSCKYVYILYISMYRDTCEGQKLCSDGTQ